MKQNDSTKITGEEVSLEEQTNQMEALLAEEGLTIDFPKRGEIRKGTIASVSNGQVLISVGAKSEGLLSGKELDAIDPEILEAFKVGDEITVFIVNPEDKKGNLILSVTRALEEENWQKAEELLASEESFESKIAGYNKGGLLVPLGTIRGFVPASQIGLGRRLTITGNSPEERYSEMVTQEIEVCVIEVDRDRRRLILSERAASSETRDSIKERVIEELEEGEVRTGRVTSLADFGAFVNINGADGLVHLSELSWEHINHPNEVLEVGQEIEVKVISIDIERKRIGLSIRRLQDDPWSDQVSALTEGQLVEGRITRLTNFGAFARLVLEEIEGELEGLIHISEISERRIEHPKEVLNEGEIVTLRIIKIEPDTHRIGLSMRRVDSPAYTDLDWKTLTNDFDMKELSEDISEEIAEEADTEEIAEEKSEPEEKAEEPEAEVDTPAEEVEEVADSTKKAKKKAEPEEKAEEPEAKVDTPVVEVKEVADTKKKAKKKAKPKVKAEEPKVEVDTPAEEVVEVADTKKKAKKKAEPKVKAEEPEAEVDTPAEEVKEVADTKKKAKKKAEPKAKAEEPKAEVDTPAEEAEAEDEEKA